METKLAKLRARWNNGDRIGALGIAAHFPRLGPYKTVITRAWAAHNNPDLYRQMGADPGELITAGLDAIREYYKLGK